MCNLYRSLRNLGCGRLLNSSRRLFRCRRRLNYRLTNRLSCFCLPCRYGCIAIELRYGNLTAVMTHTLRRSNIRKLNAKTCVGERFINGIFLCCLNVLSVRCFVLADAGGKTAYRGRISSVQIDLRFVDGNLLRDPQGIDTDSAFRVP